MGYGHLLGFELLKAADDRAWVLVLFFFGLGAVVEPVG